MKLVLCCGSGMCCALLSGLFWLGGAGIAGEATEQVEKKPGCATTASAAAGEPVELTEAEEKVVAYLADVVESGKAPMVSEEELQTEIGLSSEEIESLVESKLRPAIMAELSRRGFDLASIGGNCSKYSACSVDHNLMNAAGDELERYEAEVAMDGVTFADRIAPDFTLPNTKGKEVSLSDYRGKNVALVFLSAHCFHSLDTLPILADLKRKYANGRLEIVPVFINSGNVEDVGSRAFELDVEYPLVVSEGKQLSKAYDSRMVPSTFLIDEQGKLIKKLVGFKDQATLDQAFEELVGS